MMEGLTYIVLTALMLLLAFLIGCGIGWFVRKRMLVHAAANAAASESGVSASQTAAGSPASEAVEPASEPGPAQPPTDVSESSEAPAAGRDEAGSTSASSPASSEKDDLRRISGVGPRIEGKLNDFGIFRFSQIADWTDEDVAEFDDKLSFRGRIERDDWVGQARKLAGE